ncbi:MULTISPECIES: DUF5317 domain-containing protein [unclassified Frankia]|uniref:DUF5317 domain-containing protein n=1 Tax=unclassified Frankia TaxID=2632575 RepID=UPI00202587A6
MFVLLVLALVGGVIIGLVRGGTLDALVRIYVARPWMFVATVAALSAGRLIPGLHAVSWALATVAVVLFAAANSRLPGVGLLWAGIALNTVVILANGGQMPVSLWAAERAGVPASEIYASARHTPGGDDTVLRPATDVIPLAFPGAGSVVGIGDVLIAAGVGMFGAVAPVRARRTLASRLPPDSGSATAREPLAEEPAVTTAYRSSDDR